MLVVKHPSIYSFTLEKERQKGEGRDGLNILHDLEVFKLKLKNMYNSLQSD